MKKKVKDLTVAQLYKQCKEKESCRTCPFAHFHFCICKLNTPYDLEEETLEQEIEIPNKMINKAELLAKLEQIEENTRNISRTTTPNTPTMFNYHGRMTMIDIITGIIEDWGEEPEKEEDIPADYFRPM